MIYAVGCDAQGFLLQQHLSGLRRRSLIFSCDRHPSNAPSPLRLDVVVSTLLPVIVTVHAGVLDISAVVCDGGGGRDDDDP